MPETNGVADVSAGAGVAPLEPTGEQSATSETGQPGLALLAETGQAAEPTAGQQAGQQESAQTPQEAAFPETKGKEADQDWRRARESYSTLKSQYEAAQSELEAFKSQAGQTAASAAPPIDVPAEEWNAGGWVDSLAAPYKEKLRAEVFWPTFEALITNPEGQPEPVIQALDQMFTRQMEQMLGCSSEEIIAAAQYLRNGGQSFAQGGQSTAIAQSLQSQSDLVKQLIADGYEENHPIVAQARERERQLQVAAAAAQRQERELSSIRSEQQKLAQAQMKRERDEKIGKLDEQLNAAYRGQLASLKLPDTPELKWVSELLETVAQGFVNNDPKTKLDRGRAESFYLQDTPDMATGAIAQLIARHGHYVQKYAKPLLEALAENSRLKKLVGEQVASRREIPGGSVVSSPPARPNVNQTWEELKDDVKQKARLLGNPLTQ